MSRKEVIGQEEGRICIVERDVELVLFLRT
jgi:hypothetical protein